MNKICLLIQARMNSNRLPGKSMILIKNRVVLDHILIALKQINPKHEIVILTSELSQNDSIRNYGQYKSICVFSGDETNVASRFFNFLNNFNRAYFVRINGDSPLIDYRLIEGTLNTITNGYSIYSTVFNKTFPSGMNFEIVERKLFIESYNRFNSQEHFEHVTKYFYQNANEFKIRQIDCPYFINPDKYKFSLDTYDDLLILQKIFNKFDKEQYFYNIAEKCQYYDLIKNEK